MKILSLIIILLFNNTISFSNENKTNEILKNLRCLVCQGQTISDSNSDFALTIKEVVNENTLSYEMPLRRSIDILSQIQYCIGVSNKLKKKAKKIFL